MITFIISIIISLLIVGWLVSVYNELTKERILVKEGFSGIATGLQQRFDLIPNFVETVKGYAGHEHKTLTDVIAMRNRGLNARGPGEQAEAAAGMTRALADVFSLSEAYPELKAEAGFQSLRDGLKQIEEDLNQARRYYNGTVREYNQSIAVFPKNIIAGLFGFDAEKFFEALAGSETPPTVSFSN